MNTDRKIQNLVQNKTNIELEMQDFIGKGSYAEVYLHDIENTSVAVKCFKDQDEEYALKEGEMLEKIQMIAKDCPGIFSYYGMKKLDIKIKKKKQSLNLNYKGNCLFLQACDGNLNQIPNFPKNEIFNLLSQLSLSLFCLHKNECSHSDLKPENILFDDNSQGFRYYLADFGVSKFLQAKLNTYYQEQSVKGTPFYFSPELQAIYKKDLPEGDYNPIAADIFALGLICIEQLIGKSFILRLNKAYDQEVSFNKELENIKAQLLKLPEFQQKSYNSLLNMLLNMISFDRKLRPQAIQICQKLIEAQQFTIDTLETNNMKALITQLILSIRRIIVNSNNITYSQSQLALMEMQQQDICYLLQQRVGALPWILWIYKIIFGNSKTLLFLFLFVALLLIFSYINHYYSQYRKYNFNLFFLSFFIYNIQMIILGSKTLIFFICFNFKIVFILFSGFVLLLLQLLLIQSQSYLPSNNTDYQKFDLNEQLKNKNNLLCLLNKKMNINCPNKVIGKIMNEDKVQFQLSECEVFSIKQ